MMNYKLRPWTLPICENIHGKRCGSYWCKTQCKYCSNYQEEGDYNRVDYIFFTCTFNLRKEKLLKINNIQK